MTIAAQLNQLVAALDAWAKLLNGSAEAASDPFHLLAMLQMKPGSVRACVLCTGEAKRGDYEEGGFIDRSFSVVISRGRGFTLEPEASKTKGAANGEPLYNLVEAARDVCRGLSFDADTTEVTLNYLGWEPFPAPEGRAVDACQLNFQIGVQLPAIPEPQP